MASKIVLEGYYLIKDDVPVAGGFVHNGIMSHHGKASAEFLCLVHNLPGYYDKNKLVPRRHFQWAKYYPAHWHPAGKIIQAMAIRNQKE